MLTKTINPFVSNTDNDKLYSNLAGLDNHLIECFAKLSHDTTMEYEQILNVVKNPGNSSDPECLSYIQQQVAEYNLDVSLFQTLTRKGVMAIETLLKT